MFVSIPHTVLFSTIFIVLELRNREIESHYIERLWNEMKHSKWFTYDRRSQKKKYNIELPTHPLNLDFRTVCRLLDSCLFILFFSMEFRLIEKSRIVVNRGIEFDFKLVQMPSKDELWLQANFSQEI